MNDRLYTSDEVAGLLRVHPATVRRWIGAGQMNAIRLPGGKYRITETEIDRLRKVPAA
jgi:excisionase family DNA binding protein